MLQLKSLNFGNVAGENESQDIDFLDLFYTGNNKYNELLTRNKFIVSGRKGTGKTILAKYFQEKTKEKYQCSDYIKFDDINNLKIIENLKHNNYDLYFYNFFIYINITKTLINNKQTFLQFFKHNHNLFSYLKYKKGIKVLEKFYTDRYICENFEPISRQETITSNDLLSINSEYQILKCNVNAQDAQEQLITYQKSEYFEVAENFKVQIYNILKYSSILLIFDDFDEINMEYDELLHSIHLFIEACKNINHDFNKISNDSKCVLLIRDDVLYEINKKSSNMNKTINDCVVYLNWMNNNYFQLKEMILTKIQNSCYELKNSSLKTIESQIFRKDTFKYILDRGLGRPRDLILYLNKIKEAFPNDKSITKTMVKNCELEYSRAFLSELSNELYLHGKSDTLHDFVNLVRNYGYSRFSFDQINSQYNLNPEKYPNIISLEDCLTILYTFSVIGNFDDNNDSYFHNWHHRENGAKTIDFNKNLVVHSSLIKAANIQKGNKTKSTA